MPLAAFPKCYLDALLVTRTMTTEDWVDLAATELNIDGVELYTPLFAEWPTNRVNSLRKRIESCGLQMPMLCHSPDFTIPDNKAREQEIQAQRDAIRLTQRLGGSYCRVLSGQRRPGLTRAQGIALAVDSIHRVLPDAEAHGIVLYLENHYKDGAWKYPEFAQQTDVFLELLEKLGEHPNLAVNFDPSNALVAGEDPLRLLAAVRDRVATMHASDRYLEGGSIEDLHRLDADPHTGYASLLRHGVIGEGLNDYDAIFAQLADAGFHGWISIEDGDDPIGGIERLQLSATFLRAKMAEFGLP